MRKPLFLILGVLTMGHLNAQDSISLDALVKKAKEHSPQQAQLSLIDQITGLQIRNLKGAYLPQSSLGGQATWQSEVTSLSISLPGVEIQPPPRDQYKVTLDIQQNLWDGGVTASKKGLVLAGQKVEKAKVDVDLFKTEEQLTQLYFGVIFADRQKTNAQLILKEIDANIAKVKSAVENGIAINSNVLALKAKKLELQQQLVDIQTKKESALEGIFLLTGVELDENVSFPTPVSPITDLSQNTRPELNLLAAQQQSVLASENLIKAKNMPKLVLFGTGGYGRPGLNFLARDFSSYFIGGVQLKVPLSHLYNGGQSNEIQQASINRLRIDQQKETFTLASNIQLAAQKKELERLEQLVESDQKLIEIREQITKVANAQLENGVITATDYLEELNKEDLAKQTLILHEVQHMQTGRNIKLILGQ